MRTFYVSFVIRDDRGYAERYDALMDALRALSPNVWWAETTSFIVLRTALETDAIVAHIENAIDPTVDIALLAATDFKIMRVIGASKDSDIYKLVDFAKKA